MPAPEASAAAEQTPQPEYSLSADQTHNRWSSTIPPALTVPSGAVVEVFTKEASDGQLNLSSSADALLTLDAWRAGKLRDAEFAEKAGVPNTGSAIQDGLDAMSSLIDDLLAAGVTVLDAKQVAPPAPGEEAEEKKLVCISGKLPSGKKKADYKAPLEAAGFQLVDKVNAETNYLVLADPNSTSSKAQKARKKGKRG